MRLMHLTDIPLTETLEELTVHGTSLFPCSACDEDLDMYINGAFTWHWHQEIELITVAEGAMRASCNESEYVVPEGGALFINSNVLHTGKRDARAKTCRIHSLVFHPDLVGGFAQSAIQQQYILPLTRCAALSSCALSKGVPWQAEAIAHLSAAYDAYTGDEFGQEMVVQYELAHFMHAIVAHNEQTLAESVDVPDRDALRIRQMLQYIQSHYAQPLTVSSIAANAAVSESECYRCFRKMLGSSPIDYLHQHRLRVAAGLLAGSDRSILDICLAVGFNSPSYFSKVFKQSMGLSPREYRSAKQA